MPFKVYISGIIPENQPLPQKVKDRIVDYIDRGYGLVITSRTRSRVREEMRRFLKDNHFNRLPKVEFIGTCEYNPELCQCYPELYQYCPDIKTAFSNGIGLFIWDEKDPYTFYEMLFYCEYNPIEVYMTNKTEFISTSEWGMTLKNLVPKRVCGSIPYTQPITIPSEIMNALTFSEYVMNHISRHQWTRKSILAMILFSNIHLSQKTELYYQLTKQEDIIADMFDCYEDESIYSLSDLIEDSAFLCYEESKLALNYHKTHSGNDIFQFSPSESCMMYALHIKYHKGRVVNICYFHLGMTFELTDLYANGDIIGFSDGSTAIMCDSVTNCVILDVSIPEKPFLYDCYRDYLLLDSYIKRELSPGLLSLVKTIEPDYKGGRLCSDTLSRIKRIINLYEKEHNYEPEEPTYFTLKEIIQFLEVKKDIPNHEN